MSTKTEQITKLEESTEFLADISKLHPSTWKLNEMKPERFAEMKEGMKDKGITFIDPIQVAKYPTDKEGEFHIVNGTQRFNAAVQLGWKEMRAKLRLDVHNDEEALDVNYVKNRDRGDIDPFSEGRYFKHLHDTRKWNNVQIAKFAHVHEDTVARRLKLANATAATRQLLSEGYSLEQVEKIAGMPAELQDGAVADIKEDLGSYESETDIDFIVKDRTKKAEEKERVQQKIKDENAKYPKCFEGHEAIGTSQSYMGGWPWVYCEIGYSRAGKHVWNAKTGETYSAHQAAERAKEIKQQGGKVGSGKVEKPYVPKPQFIPTIYTDEQYAWAFEQYARKFLAKFRRIASIKIVGQTKEGKPLELAFTGPSRGGLYLMWNETGNFSDETGWEIRAAVHDEKAKLALYERDQQLIDPLTTVTRLFPHPKTNREKDLQSSLKYVEKLITKYPLPRQRKPKAERKRKK